MKAPDSVTTSRVGETMIPPRTRQLKFTSRDNGRYQARPAVNRVNCCSVEEPMYLELQVSSILVIDPRVGSITLFAWVKVASAASVASGRLSLSAAMTSLVQALKNEQKLASVASVRPYDRV